MKALSSLVLLCLLIVSTPAHGLWKNGGSSDDIDSIIFGTHDWIAWKAFLIANKDNEFDWLKKNENYMFFGTEAPDLGKKKLPLSFQNQITGKYHDTGACHCVLYNKQDDLIKTRAADRIITEFNLAKKAFKAKKWKLAAFYVGTMAHYAGDLSQFMHLMGKGSRWNNGKSENTDVHSGYEAVLDARVDFHDRSLAILESYIKKASISGDTPEEIAYEIAEYTDHGTNQNTGWMYSQATSYFKTNELSNPELWNDAFTDQTGRNVNKAINGIAKLISMLDD